MLGPFRELVVGVGFGLSMLVGAMMGTLLIAYVLQVVGIRVTEGPLLGGVCFGVVFGGACWKMLRFMLEQAIKDGRYAKKARVSGGVKVV